MTATWRTRLPSARSLTRALLLAAWAAFFLYLWISGERVRYIGPRTEWIVPFGTIALTVAAVAHLLFLKGGGGREPLRRSEFLGALVTLLPILLVLSAPAPQLGALAASRKSGTTSGLASAIAFAPPAPGSSAPSFIDVHYANLSADYAAQAGIVEGAPMALTGFVTHGGAGDYNLTRFYISCCAADAIPYSVTIVDTGNDYPDDTWLTITGNIVPLGKEYALTPTEIKEVSAPKNPYLS